MENIDLSYFPHNWDIDNEQQFNFYKKCFSYIDSEDDFENIIERHTIFKIFGVGAIIYFFIIGLILIKYRKHHILRRQGIYYYVFILGSIISSTNSFLMQIYKKTYPCIVLNFLLCIGYPLGLFSYSLIILNNFKNYYYSQIAYTEMFDNRRTEKYRSKFLFRYIYENMPQTRVATFFVYYLCVKWIYVYVLYFVDSSVRQEGFCTIKIIHLPQVFENLGVMFVFLPLAFVEVLKFDDAFKMKRKIIKAIVTTIICFIGYIVISLSSKIACSTFVKILPSDAFVILVFICSSIFLCIPTIKEIKHFNSQQSETKATKNGMLKMLEDNILLREFSEFCMKENSAENILFYRDYWKFKKLFDNKRASKNIKYNYHGSTYSTSGYESESHELSEASFEHTVELSVYNEEEIVNANMINGMEPDNNFTESGGYKSNINIQRKITKNDTLIREATKLIQTYINVNSKFEVNISEKIKKKVIYEFKEIINNELQQQEFKNKLISLFDDAYQEVIDNLFLNSYTNYIALKKSQLQV